MSGGPSRAVVLCAVGLLVVLADVRAFGTDLTDDTLGYLLVALGALGLRGQRRWVAVLVAAALAGAVLALFAYGGLASRRLAPTPLLWEGVGYALLLAETTVVLALVLVLRDRLPAAPGVRRGVAVAGVALAAATALRVSLLATGRDQDGTGFALDQLAAATQGLVPLAAVVLLLVLPTPARDEAPPAVQKGPRR